jgi:hypothetical protein
MKTVILFLLAMSLSGAALAGTSLKADLLSLSHKDAWVNLNASISGNKMRLDFEGPWTKGALIYDNKSSLLTVVDHLHKSIINLGSGSQTGIKIFLALFSGQIKKQASGTDDAAKRTFEMAQQNARALFNGIPGLVKKGVRKNAFTCDQFATSLDGAKVRDVWIVSPEKAGMSAEDYGTLIAMVSLAMELGGSVLDQFGADTKAFQKNLSEPQLPAAVQLFAKGKTSARFKISSIKTKNFEEGVFLAPAEYKTLGLLDLMRQ